VEPLRIAVIGAGYWRKKVIRETLDVGRTTGRVQVHAVVDNSPTMLSHCQNEFGPLTQQISITPSNTLREEVEHFPNCITSHQDSKPFPDQSDGVLGARVVSVLESARESIRQERTMQVQMPTAEEIPVK
jgi:predicted dehydrogenase